jgi:hypothetical protein
MLKAPVGSAVSKLTKRFIVFYPIDLWTIPEYICCFDTSTKYVVSVV